MTTYTFGQDLYDDMLAAIEGAQKQVLFETYIWKGDAVGQRFKKALIDAADRGVEVTGHLRRSSPTSWCVRRSSTSRRT